MRRLVLILFVIYIAFNIFVRNITGIDHTLYNSSQYLFKLDANGEATIVDFTLANKQSVLNIPSFLNGYKVVGIAKDAFDTTDIMELSIPTTIKSIEENAFRNCTNILSLAIGADCVTDNSFDDLSNVKRLNILGNKGTVMIDYKSNEQTPWYSSKDSIERVSLSSGILNVGNYSFEDMSLLAQVDLSDSIEYIGLNAFNGDESLKKLVLPQGLKSIAEGAIDNLSDKTTVIVTGESDVIKSISLNNTNSYVIYNAESTKDYFTNANIQVENKEFKFESDNFVILLGSEEAITIDTEEKVTYQSSDESILTIDDKGRIQTISTGVATVYGIGEYAKTEATVEIIGLDDNQRFVLIETNNTYSLDPNHFGVMNSTNIEECHIENSDSKVVAITNGEIVGKSNGRCEITISDSDGNIGQYIVNVITKVKEISLTEQEVVLKRDGRYKIKAEIAPSNASNKKLKYTSSNVNVATVSADGTVTAINDGVATITITSTDGSFVSSELKVNVTSAAITCENHPAILMPGKIYRLRCSILDGTKLSYMIIDEDIATIDDKGVITANKEGTTYIVVYNENNTVYRRLKCVVYDAVSYGIDLSEWNGRYYTSANFLKAKADGIDFVYLRAAYEDDYEDPVFERNYQAAKQAGLDVGAYHYITATTVEKATSEANWMLKVLAGKKFEYPVMLDIESNKHKALSVYQWNVIVQTYCSILEEAGYKTVVYSYASQLKRLTVSYDAHVANWGVTKPDIDIDYTMWQFTSDGLVNGLNGRIDMNICFVDYPSYIKENHLNGY